jgi:hypothetical protein
MTDRGTASHIDSRPEFISATGHAIAEPQPPESWSRTAVHSGSGLVSLRQFVLQIVRHLRHHLPFIAEKHAAFGGTQS